MFGAGFPIASLEMHRAVLSPFRTSEDWGSGTLRPLPERRTSDLRFALDLGAEDDPSVFCFRNVIE
jgi:hypothetical protein